MLGIAARLLSLALAGLPQLPQDELQAAHRCACAFPCSRACEVTRSIARTATSG